MRGGISMLGRGKGKYFPLPPSKPSSHQWVFSNLLQFFNWCKSEARNWACQEVKNEWSCWWSLCVPMHTPFYLHHAPTFPCSVPTTTLPGLNTVIYQWFFSTWIQDTLSCLFSTVTEFCFLLELQWTSSSREWLLEIWSVVMVQQAVIHSLLNISFSPPTKLPSNCQLSALNRDYEESNWEQRLWEGKLQLIPRNDAELKLLIRECGREMSAFLSTVCFYVFM